METLFSIPWTGEGSEPDSSAGCFLRMRESLPEGTPVGQFCDDGTEVEYITRHVLRECLLRRSWTVMGAILTGWSRIGELRRVRYV